MKASLMYLFLVLMLLQLLCDAASLGKAEAKLTVESIAPPTEHKQSKRDIDDLQKIVPDPAKLALKSVLRAPADWLLAGKQIFFPSTKKKE